MAKKITIRGERVKGLRETHQLTQSEVEGRSGVDRSLISRIERGIRPNVYVETAGGLARALNTTADYLLGLTDRPWPPDESSQPSTEIEWQLLEEFRKIEDSEDRRYALAQLRMFVEHAGQRRPEFRIVGDEPPEEETQAS